MAGERGPQLSCWGCLDCLGGKDVLDLMVFELVEGVGASGDCVNSVHTCVGAQEEMIHAL